jgi:hypothetical protein
VFIYSLLGRELFAHKMAFHGDTGEPVHSSHDEATLPDSTFNGFGESMVSIFIVLANDGWSTIYFDHYRSVGQIGATIYFVLLLMIG